MLQLYLRHDFYNITFEIKYKLYITSDYNLYNTLQTVNSGCGTAYLHRKTKRNCEENSNSLTPRYKCEMPDSYSAGILNHSAAYHNNTEPLTFNPHYLKLNHSNTITLTYTRFHCFTVHFISQMSHSHQLTHLF